MVSPRLTYDDVRGVFAIMPTPATAEADSVSADETVDLNETERGATKLVRDGVDAIMINGTFGEAATLLENEWKAFTETVIDAVDGGVPVVAGPTTLNTRDTIRRARFARDAGADGLLLGRPMWLELNPEATVQFYRDVAEAVPELGIVVYHNPPAFKNKITPEMWEQLAEIPQVVAAKYGAIDAAWRDSVVRVGDEVKLLPIERKWKTAHTLFPERIDACWSGSASCDPLPVTMLRDAIFDGEEEQAAELTDRLVETYTDFYPEEGKRAVYPEAMNARHDRAFSLYTIALQKSRFNGAGYIEAGPVRPPYHVAPEGVTERAYQSGQAWAELVGELEAERDAV